MKKHALILLILLFSIYTTFAQSSRIPKESDNWLQVTGRPGHGDRDGILVIIFEVPDTVPADELLYFGINSPALGTSPHDSGDDGVMEFHLVGGSGAFSHPSVKRLKHETTPTKTSALEGGALLNSLTYDHNSADTGWTYFSGVYPAQGEHIGNRYYFRVVAYANGDFVKNAFQADLSSTVSATPSQISGARAFSYCWSIAMDNRLNHTWNIHPFVPDNAQGDIICYNYDFDEDEQIRIYYNGSVTPLSGTHPISNITEVFKNYNIPTGERNKTWRMEITELDNFAFSINPGEVWATNSFTGELYRLYSDAVDYSGIDAHSVSINSEDGKALVGGTDSETITLQVLDSSGNPVPYSRKIYVTVDNGAIISEINSAANNSSNALITTNSDGTAYLKVTKSAPAAVVTVTAYWDGTGSSDSLVSATGGSVTVNFETSLPPTISSANNSSYNRGDPSTTAQPITISTGTGPSQISSGNDIRVRIPDSLDCSFDTTITTLSFSGTASGSVSTSVSYENSGKIAVINVTGSFGASRNLTINNLKLNSFRAAGSGYLILSVDGGTTYPVTDDKRIVIYTATPLTISSAGSSSYYTGAPSTTAPNITVSTGSGASQISDTNDIRIKIPAGLNCTFDTAVTTLSFSGSASGSVSPTVSYDGTAKIVTIDVTGTFGSNKYLIISGLKLNNFGGVSSGKLLLSTDGGTNYPAEDDKTITIIALPTLSSASNSSFNVGEGSTAAPNMTVTTGAGTSPINSVNNIKIQIPNALKCSFDTTVTTLSFSGTASGAVSTTVSYDGSGKIVTINVTGTFGASQNLVISGLKFNNFTAASSDKLLLSVDGGTNYPVTDDKTITISNITAPTLSSASNSSFNIGEGSTAAPNITVTTGAGTSPINSVNNIKIQIPNALKCSFDTTVTTLSFSGTASGAVSTTVSYDGSGKIVTINVTGSFGASQNLVISGLKFNNFTAASSDKLLLSVDGGTNYPVTDDKTITINNNTPPSISLRRTVVGSNKIYVEFTVPVFKSGGGTITADDFSYTSNTVPAISLSSITDLTGANRIFIFETSAPLSDENIVGDTINAKSGRVVNGSNIAMATTTYTLSDIGLNFFTNVELQDLKTGGGLFKISNLEGGERFSPESLRIVATVDVAQGAYMGAVPKLHYNSYPNSDAAAFWDPASESGDEVVNGRSLGGNSWEFLINGSDSRLKAGNTLSLVFSINGLYCYRAPREPADAAFSPKDAECYLARMQSLVKQSGGVTITNNVINPGNGDRTALHYSLEKAGPVSIVVYDLKGNVVEVLVNYAQSKGNHTVYWTGRNLQLRTVARGVYFIRVRAPGIGQQIRKVLVVK